MIHIFFILDNEHTLENSNYFFPQIAKNSFRLIRNRKKKFFHQFPQQPNKSKRKKSALHKKCKKEKYGWNRI